jgi:3-oxoadipate enol-lactonase
MTIPLQYRIDGPRHAPVVLLVPPFGTTLSVWEPQMPELTRNRRVLRINHRGHGSSPAAGGSCGVEDLALDVLALLEKLELTRVSAVGAGFAASLVVWIAANSPRTLERIALLAAAPRTPTAHKWSRLADRVREAGMESVLADVSLPWFTPDMGEERPDVVERFAGELGRIDAATFASVCDAVHTMDQRHLVAGGGGGGPGGVGAAAGGGGPRQIRTASTIPTPSATGIAAASRSSTVVESLSDRNMARTLAYTPAATDTTTTRGASTAATAVRRRARAKTPSAPAAPTVAATPADSTTPSSITPSTGSSRAAAPRRDCLPQGRAWLRRTTSCPPLPGPAPRTPRHSRHPSGSPRRTP